SAATVRAPRSRARRSAAAALRRSTSSVVSARGPSPATTTRLLPVWTCITCPAFALKLSASSAALRCPPAARSRRASASGRLVAHDALHDAGDGPHPDREATLLGNLTRHRLARRLAEVHEPAGEAPLARGGRLAAPDEQHAALAEDNRADADPRVLRVLAAHA